MNFSPTALYRHIVGSNDAGKSQISTALERGFPAALGDVWQMTPSHEHRTVPVLAPEKLTRRD